eukprot:12898432-Alexandrium_andersonii.AAC.1
MDEEVVVEEVVEDVVEEEQCSKLLRMAWLGSVPVSGVPLCQTYLNVHPKKPRPGGSASFRVLNPM